MTSLRILHGILDKYIAGTVEGVDGKDRICEATTV